MPSAHVGGKPDRLIVPKKPPNKSVTEVAPAEAVEEERGLTEGNIGQTAVPRTQSRTRTSNGLAGVRRVARADITPVTNSWTLQESEYTRKGPLSVTEYVQLSMLPVISVRGSPPCCTT